MDADAERRARQEQVHARSRPARRARTRSGCRGSSRWQTAISAFGKAGERAAAGEIDADAVQQRHGAEGDQDRMDADDGDQQAGDEADERRTARSRRRGRRRATRRAAAPAASGGIRRSGSRPSASPAWLAVAMIARLMPPEISGIAMASDSRPSSGSWNIIACSVVPRGKVVGSTSEKKPTSSAEQGEEAAETRRCRGASQPISTIGVAGEEPCRLCVAEPDRPSAALAPCAGRRDRFAA